MTSTFKYLQVGVEVPRLRRVNTWMSIQPRELHIFFHNHHTTTHLPLQRSRQHRHIMLDGFSPGGPAYARSWSPKAVIRASLVNIETNPGPFSCAVCSATVTWRHVSFQCTTCNSWIHRKCSGLTEAQYKQQIRQHNTWECTACNPPNTNTRHINNPRQPRSQPTHKLKILQLNCNGIQGKATDIYNFMTNNSIKVALIQESKMTEQSSTLGIDRTTRSGPGPDQAFLSRSGPAGLFDFDRTFDRTFLSKNMAKKKKQTMTNGRKKQ